MKILRRVLNSIGCGADFVANKLTGGAAIASSWALLAIAFIVTGDVTARYLLGAGTKWAVELSGYILVFVVFMGLAYTLKEGGHIRITFIIDRLSKKFQSWLEVIFLTLFLVFTSILFKLTLDFALVSLAQNHTSLTGADFLLWPFQISMPLGLAIMSLFMVVDIYTKTRALLKT